MLSDRIELQKDLPVIRKAIMDMWAAADSQQRLQVVHYMSYELDHDLENVVKAITTWQCDF